MSHEEVVKKYASRQLNTRTQTVDWSGNNVFCDKDIIYSYGRHFPMAKYLGEVNSKPYFIKNGDKYSKSTSCHQGKVNHHCKGPTVSSCLLAEVGINFLDVKLSNIICVQVPMCKFIYRDTKTNRYYEEAHTRRWGEDSPNAADRFFVGALEDQLVENEWQPPNIGEFRSHKKRDINRIVSGTWTVTGAVVISNKRKYYLCSENKKGYFVAKLPKKPESIREAYDFFRT